MTKIISVERERRIKSDLWFLSLNKQENVQAINIKWGNEARIKFAMYKSLILNLLIPDNKMKLLKSLPRRTTKGKSEA